MVPSFDPMSIIIQDIATISFFFQVVHTCKIFEPILEKNPGYGFQEVAELIGPIGA